MLCRISQTLVEDVFDVGMGLTVLDQRMIELWAGHHYPLRRLWMPHRRQSGILMVSAPLLHEARPPFGSRPRRPRHRQ